MTHLPDPASLLGPLRDLAKRAGAAILDIYRGEIAVETKLDNSPVTAADLAADEVIEAGLAALTPDIAVISEEAFDGKPLPERFDDRFWLVDPLDGTREFIDRNGDFTVNIALIEHRRPILGVIHIPVQATTYSGLRDCAGAGAWREEEGGRPHAVAVRRPPPAGLSVAVSRSHLNAATRRYLEGLKVARRHQAGSSLKFCVVAAGEVDIYPRLGPTMEWDTAAGHAILCAAGGSVRTEDGAELLYAKPGLKNPNFIARGAEG